MASGPESILARWTPTLGALGLASPGDCRSRIVVGRRQTAPQNCILSRCSRVILPPPGFALGQRELFFFFVIESFMVSATQFRGILPPKI